MTTFEVRPATEADVDAGRVEFPGIVVDHWAEGSNRRCFVAATPGGDVLGSCRAVDNTAHPGSRVMALAVRAELDTADADDVRDALLRAQVEASTLPLRMKVYEYQAGDRALARRFGGVAIQATPPWRFAVDDVMRAWAADHRAAVEPIGDAHRPDVRELEVDHYLAQHASWNPAAPRAVMLDYFAEDHEPGSPTAWDPKRSVLLRREGRVVAAALLWPGTNGAPGDGREVELLSRRYEGPHARADKEACLAAIIDSAADSEVLLVNCHVTEALERDMMMAVPGRTRAATDTWMAIVSIPAPGEPRPVAVDADLLPDEADWIRDLR